MSVCWFEFKIVKLGNDSTDASMADGELDQHLDEVEAHSSALGHQVIEAETSFAFSVNSGAGRSVKYGPGWG